MKLKVKEGMMKTYRYKISHALVIIFLYLIFCSCFFIHAILSRDIKLIKLASAIFTVVLIFIIYNQVKFDRMNNVFIDEEKLIANVCKGWVSEETKMLLDDITIIRCYKKYIIIRKVEICTRYKCLRLNIRNFRNYKEMLQTLINKTNNNTRIKIDDTIYTMVK